MRNRTKRFLVRPSVAGCVSPPRPRSRTEGMARIIDIAGSLRKASFNAALLRTAAELTPAAPRSRSRRSRAFRSTTAISKANGVSGLRHGAEESDRRSRRSPARHARVQQLDARRAQERDRLAVAAAQGSKGTRPPRTRPAMGEHFCPNAAEWTATRMNSHGAEATSSRRAWSGSCTCRNASEPPPRSGRRRRLDSVTSAVLVRLDPHTS